MKKTIRRNAEGVPLITPEQLSAAHNYASDLLRTGASTRALPPEFLACALWNAHRHNEKLQEALTAIAAVLARAIASGVLTLQATADEPEDEETAAPDPRMN